MKRNIIEYKCVDSTNLKMRELVSEEAELQDGTVIAADQQSAGRGRLGRSFYSPVGAGLYMSYLIKNCDPALMPYYTPWTAVAVAEAIEESTGASAGIKWVNDIIIGERKVCGILAESVVDRSGARHAIIGIGINLRGARDAFPPDIVGKASSLEAETGVICSPRELLLAIASSLDGFSRMSDARKSELFNGYRSRSVLLDRDVAVISPSGEHEAHVLAIAENYNLIVRYWDGSEGTLGSGEVSVRMKNGQYI